MKKTKPIFFRLSFALLFCLLLCGCTKKVELSNATINDSDPSVTAVVTPEDLALLNGLDALTSADFSGSTCYEEIMDWAVQHPSVAVRYTVPFPGGVTAENTATELDLTGLTDSGADEALKNLAFLPNLKTVTLGTDRSGLSPQTALRFSDCRPISVNSSGKTAI